MAFTQEEYTARVEKARELMRAQGIDALMVTGDYVESWNYRYFTGHLPRDYQSTCDRTHVLVMTREGGAGIVAHWTGAAAARATWVDDVRTYTPPFAARDVEALFAHLGVEGGRVAAELGNDLRMAMPFAEFDALRRGLPKVEWVDAGPVIWPLRQVKSPAEVACIEQADRINLEGLRRTFARARAGMTEAELYHLCASCLVEVGAAHPPHTQVTVISSARGRAGNGSTPRLAKGDAVFVDSGCIHDGYWGEFNRMAVVGPPTAEQERVHRAVRDVNQTWWTDTLRPGITAAAALEHHIQMLERAGISPADYSRDSLVKPPYSHHAHGIGLNSSEPPRARMVDQTVLRAGMVINVETYIQGPDMRYAAEEDVLVTEDGARPLSEVDSGLFVID